MKKQSHFYLYYFRFAVLDHNWARLVKSTDLSTLKVDYLSDSDISKIKTQLQSNNLTIDQAEPMALSECLPLSLLS
jgi:hypothetical protein